MTHNQPHDLLDFLSVLSRDFPRDPEVLYAATHAYSDLSLRASQDLAREAPFSYQVHLLNAEALELQGKWDEAAAEYRRILEINPFLPGIHARRGTRTDLEA
jgi:tetratricopeptide (TPR) repeat protein